MIRLLIISDDFTGALDVGVQFASHGAKTSVVTDSDSDWCRDLDVLVLDAETRHMAANDAYKVVLKIVEKAKKLQIPHIYKKTDSALRGNIGAELSAVLHASGEKHLAFLPAFPKLGRLTIGGIHYIQGVPVAESVFGSDPFEPVTESCIRKLLEAQATEHIEEVSPNHDFSKLPDSGGILVFDASSENDLRVTGLQLQKEKKLSLMAGCAGFASILPELLMIGTPDHIPTIPSLNARLLVFCGSVNPITLSQLDHAEKCGFLRLRMTPEQKLEDGYWSTDYGKAQIELWCRQLLRGNHTIVDSADKEGSISTSAYAKERGLSLEDIRIRVSNSLGQILQAIDSYEIPGTILVTGGDTLMQCMSTLGIHEIEPICEMAAGVVLSSFSHHGFTRYVITKSGGFGDTDLLTNLAAQLAHTSDNHAEGAI